LIKEAIEISRFDLLNRQISLFSGEDFTVDETVGLNGMCDFLLSRSSEVLEIEAPAIAIEYVYIQTVLP